MHETEATIVVSRLVNKAAVDACIQESSTGDCKCENGCGNYDGPIGEWDVSEVTDMKKLFFEKLSFNADISKWDTSHVINMNRMWVSLFHKLTPNRDDLNQDALSL